MNAVCRCGFVGLFLWKIWCEIQLWKLHCIYLVILLSEDQWAINPALNFVGVFSCWTQLQLTCWGVERPILRVIWQYVPVFCHCLSQTQLERFPTANLAYFHREEPAVSESHGRLLLAYSVTDPLYAVIMLFISAVADILTFDMSDFLRCCDVNAITQTSQRW